VTVGVGGEGDGGGEVGTTTAGGEIDCTGIAEDGEGEGEGEGEDGEGEREGEGEGEGEEPGETSGNKLEKEGRENMESNEYCAVDNN
jgi:hypothetical protein